MTKKTEQSEWLSPYEDLIEEGENEFNCGRDEKAREIFRRLIELGEPIGYVKLANSFRGELSAKEEAERIALCRKAGRNLKTGSKTDRRGITTGLPAFAEKITDQIIPAD